MPGVQALTLLNHWLSLPEKRFDRAVSLSSQAIACDCSGLFNLLCDALGITKPFNIERPKAVDYFSLLQEVGSDNVGNLTQGCVLAWRKEVLPKSGDTGHVAMVCGPVEHLSAGHYLVPVVDASKACLGIAERTLELFSDERGKIQGVRLSAADKKIKRTAIYHHPLSSSRYCFGCALPKRVCNCNAIEAVLTSPSVVILRHPQERKKTLATVSLIKQRYPRILVKDGEIFSPMRGAQWRLLFPDDQSQAVDDQNQSLGENPRAEPLSESLILIDATWRKAKKILYSNAWLNSLPKVSLSPNFLSHYRLRKVPSDQALSSVETVACVLRDEALIELLDAVTEKHIEQMGLETYQKNYTGHINFSGE